MAAPTSCTIVRVFHGGHTNWARAVVISRDGTRLASCDSSGRVVVWDTDTGRCLCVCSKIDAWIEYVVFSPHGDHLVCGNYRFGKIFVWHTGSDREVMDKQLDTPLDGSVYCTTWTPDGAGVVLGYTDGKVERWTLVTVQRVWQAKHHSYGVNCVGVAPDGQTGASGYSRGSIQLWQVEDGQLLRTIQTDSLVTCLVFVPDGQWLASASLHNIVMVWNVATGQHVHELRGNTNIVQRLVFTRCGRRVISASWNNTVYMWDTAKGQLLHTVTFAPACIEDICVAPDGTVMVATIHRTVDVMLWRISFDDV